MTRVVKLRRGFWTSLAVLLAWISIPQGVYSITQGTIEFFAILNIVLGALAIVLALLDSVAEKLMAISVELWRIAAFLAIFLFFGLTQVITYAPSFSLSPAEQAFTAVYRIVTVLLMLIVLWQLVKALRDSSVSVQ